MPHNFPVLDNSYIRFTPEAHKAIATSKQSYKYLLVGFAGFLESFSDVGQNMSAAYIIMYM